MSKQASAGFHCESFDYLKSSAKLTTKDLKTLQTKTFFGKEKKSLAYVIGIMNMILHGIEAPNIVHTNTFLSNTDNASVSLRKLPSPFDTKSEAS